LNREQSINQLLELPLNERPQCLAELVHEVQTDKSGAQYIDHPRRVAQNARLLATLLNLETAFTHAALAVAWLHDVIEDSGDQPFGDVTASNLEELGFSAETIAAVVLLTRVHGERDEDAYYHRINENQLARLVKIADVADNRNFERRAELSASDTAYFERKYGNALELLDLNDVESAFYQKRIQLPTLLDGLGEAELLGL
jgi:(p)ppGpp synthase/HD superfamily hydrolase